MKLITPLLMVLVGTASALSTADGMEGEEPTPTPTATVTATSTMTPTPTSTPQPSSTPMPTVTPTPTYEKFSDGVEFTAQRKIVRCSYYLGIVHSWLDLEPSEFVNELDPVLVLAVGAAETGCEPNLVSSAGAIGIMQVIPKPWTAGAGSLYEPRINIYWGMYILDHAITNADQDLRYGLAYYNCSEQSVHANKCGSLGGLNYADKVLNFWYPRVRDHVYACTAKYGETFWSETDYIRSDQTCR